VKQKKIQIKFFEKYLLNFYFLSCILLLWVPLLCIHITKAEYLVFGNESLAYRFFLSESAWLGQPTFMWQGHLTTLLQNLIYQIQHITPPIDFRSELQSFGVWTTIVIASSCSAIVVFASLSRYLRESDKVILASLSILFIYGLRGNGINYYLLPDYYGMSIALSLSSSWLTILIARRYSVDNKFLAIYVGILCGLWLGNKASMVIMMLPAVLLLLSKKDKIINFFYILIALVITTPLIFIIYYNFHIQPIKEFFKIWLSLVSASTGEGSGNIKSWIYSQFNSQYRYIFIGSSVSGILASFYCIRYRADQSLRILTLASWLLYFVFIFVLLKRPSGTTMFDAGLAMVLLIGVWTYVLITYSRYYSYVLVIISVIFSFVSVQNDLNFSTKPQTDAEAEWNFFYEVQKIAGQKNTLVIIPTNEYGHGGVHELLLKGTSDFPSWHISERGEKLIDRHTPNIRFKNQYEGLITLDPPPKNTVIVWNDRPDLKPLTEDIEDLRKLNDDVRYSCTRFPIKSQNSVRTIANICSPL